MYFPHYMICCPNCEYVSLLKLLPLKADLVQLFCWAKYTPNDWMYGTSVYHLRLKREVPSVLTFYALKNIRQGKQTQQMPSSSTCDTSLKLSTWRSFFLSCFYRTRQLSRMMSPSNINERNKNRFVTDWMKHILNRKMQKSNLPFCPANRSAPLLPNQSPSLANVKDSQDSVLVNAVEDFNLDRLGVPIAPNREEIKRIVSAIPTDFSIETLSPSSSY